VPELRFAGFADDWEERKLESFTLLITKQTGFDYSATIKPALVNKSEGNVYPFIQNKNFSGFKINMNTDFYIPIEVANKFPRITLDQPSLLVTISGNIGNVGLYNSDEKAFVGGAVGICKLNNLIEGEFILYELESDFGQRQFKRSTKSSSHANITVEMIKNIDILIPKNELEQKKIGSFFKQLDDTIALHQRKLDLLKEQKKGFLQKMFV
ncbi:MAG: restriction endonuclease subunit S, partial [Lactococcus lactis]